MFTWRTLNALGAVVSAALWGVASFTGWINSVAFIAHISMATMIFTFVAAWRADEPDPE